MEPLEAELIAAVGARPGDPEPRAVLEDHLLERGHPGARFIELDRALCETPRDNPRFAGLDAELAEVAAGLDPAWMIAVGELDAARFDVVGTSRRALCAALVRLRLPHQSRQVDRVFERGLRRIDARILAGGLGPQIGLAPNRPVTAIARLRRLLPRPHLWLVRQPAFNQMWHPRADPGQRTPPLEDIYVDDGVDVVLRERGPRMIPVIKAIRGYTGLGLAPARELSELGGVIAVRVDRSRANEIVAELRSIGATAEIAGGCAPAGDDFDSVRGGDPTAVDLEATDERLVVNRFRGRLVGAHDAEPDLRAELALPIDQALERWAEILAAVRRVTANLPGGD
jgi:hypothetical protein